MTMETFKRLYREYWESITWSKALISSALTVVALFFGWHIILNFPGYAEEQGVTIERGKMLVGIIGMVLITLVGVYWSIAMFVAASDNEKRRR